MAYYTTVLVLVIAIIVFLDRTENGRTDSTGEQIASNPTTLHEHPLQEPTGAPEQGEGDAVPTESLDSESAVGQTTKHSPDSTLAETDKPAAAHAHLAPEEAIDVASNVSRNNQQTAFDQTQFQDGTNESQVAVQETNPVLPASHDLAATRHETIDYDRHEHSTALPIQEKPADESIARQPSGDRNPLYVDHESDPNENSDASDLYASDPYPLAEGYQETQRTEAQRSETHRTEIRNQHIVTGDQTQRQRQPNVGNQNSPSLRDAYVERQRAHEASPNWQRENRSLQARHSSPQLPNYQGTDPRNYLYPQDAIHQAIRRLKNRQLR